MSTQKPKYVIDVEGIQRTSQLGVTDPDTGVRYAWDPEFVIGHLTQRLAEPGFTPERYCNRCEAYDRELGIRPWQKKLPRLRRRSIVKVQPVDLP